MNAAMFHALGRDGHRRGERHRTDRGVRGRGQAHHDSAAAVDPARLDTVPFAALACRLAFSRGKGDEQLWARLLHADLVVRTENALRGSQQRNAAAIEKRRKDWIRHTESQVGMKVDEEQWRIAKQEFHDWCARADNFAEMVAKALQEVQRVRRRLVGGDDGTQAGGAQYLDRLQVVAGAIRAHRAALDDGEVIAEEHDLRLWSVLDTVTVDDDATGHKPLAAMFDEQIWESK